MTLNVTIKACIFEMKFVKITVARVDEITFLNMHSYFIADFKIQSRNVVHWILLKSCLKIKCIIELRCNQVFIEQILLYMTFL